jgi:hypothetical protein
VTVTLEPPARAADREAGALGTAARADDGDEAGTTIGEAAVSAIGETATAARAEGGCGAAWATVVLAEATARVAGGAAAACADHDVAVTTTTMGVAGGELGRGMTAIVDSGATFAGATAT